MEKFFYRVQAGDSVSTLSQRFCVPLTIIIKDNNLKKPIRQGQVLVINCTKGRLYKVKPHQTIEQVAKELNVDKQKIINDNGVDYLYYGLTILV